MSLKKLFNRTKSKKLLGSHSAADTNKHVESEHFIKEQLNKKIRFEYPIDFNTASNFAIYGSAEEYYESAIEAIHNSYPYDGSKYEKLQWLNNSSQFQLHILNNEYPKEYGHAVFNASNSVSVKSNSGSVNNHSNPTTKEYIFMKGGPHIDNLWDSGSFRTSNLEINGKKGNTVEFWLKKAGFSTSNRREVLLDVWSSGTVPSSAKYARFTVELDQQQQSSGYSPFVITYKSGSTGVHQASLGETYLANSGSDDKWHHYAISIQNSGSNLSMKMYIDGQLNDTKVTGSSVLTCNKNLIGTIGALATGKAGKGESEDPPYNAANSHNLGWGKLSGSIDEFRFWKARRKDWEIGRHWFTQVDGGTNTDDPNTSLGVYYKFNEGKTDNTALDAAVLDYSGRITNGEWTGYASSSRRLKSAIVESSSSLDEPKDPIMDTENPRLINYKSSKVLEGYERDLTNNSCLINSMPDWLIEDDGPRGNTRKLLQIIGTYFDDMHLKIQHLPTLKHKEYYDFSKAAPPHFMSQILASHGLQTSDMFLDASIIESLTDRTEEFTFKESLQDVKNYIYRNIYNILTYLYKSKGTEKAFRNILRAHGIDEELVKLNIYASDATYELKTNYRVDSYKKKYINFHKPSNQSATIYQYSSSFGKDRLPGMPTRGYVSGSHAGNTSSGFSSTTEVEAIFPYIHSPGTDLRVDTPTSSSLYGCGTVPQTIGDAGDLTVRAGSKNFANFQVCAVKSKLDERSAKFVLKSQDSVLPSLETPHYRDVYGDKKWNFAVRVIPDEGRFTSLVSGSAQGYELQFYGVNMESDVAAERFFLTRSLSKAQGENFHKYSKRFFIGAYRQNFTGSLYTKSDAKISSFRHWFSDIDNATIDEHAKDSKNHGVRSPQKNAFSFHQGIDVDVPMIDTLAINWDFAMVTGSSIGGQFVVQDFSSGSHGKTDQYGWVGDVVSYNHPARGDFFESSTTASVTTEFVPTVKQQTFENIHGSSLVRALSNEDQAFPKNARPSSYYFAFEKSLYSTVNQEILDMFGTIKDFSNLIGQPVNRYRQEYKQLGKLRQLFFEKVQNTPDVEKYMEYYKWLDSSIDTILEQFIPASAQFSEGIKNIVESHVLERNKYWSKYPTIEMKNADPEGRVLGINELLYNWKHGHASSDLDLVGTITPAAAASVDIVAQTMMVSIYDGGTIALIDAAGTSKTYIFDDDSDGATGTLDGSGRVRIQLNGLGNINNIATQIRAAIIHSNGHNGTILATDVGSDTGKVSLVQATGGTAGNTSITNTTSGVAISIQHTAAPVTAFKGGTDATELMANQADNCLWWKDRAERSATSHISTGDASVDRSREKLRKAINSVVSGSNYTIRKLTRPYRLQAGLSHPIHGGDNFFPNKKKDFFLGTSNPHSAEFIRISGSDINAGTDCSDVYIPRVGTGMANEDGGSVGSKVFERKKFRGTADISNTNRDHDLNLVAPFALYSSSMDAPTDYKAVIFKDFKQGVDITNLHSDAYGDDREIPMQGPFTEFHVGGHQHRHTPLNTSASLFTSGSKGRKYDKLDTRRTRREAFYLTMSSGELFVLNPSHEYHRQAAGDSNEFVISSTGAFGRASVLREPLAKRPLNIRNIKTTTGSLNLGNYTRDYEIVSTTAPSREFILNNEKRLYPVQLYLSKSSGLATPDEVNFFLNQEFSSSYFWGMKDRVKPQRPRREHTIVSRFAAPGGPETAGDAHGGAFLDVETNQFSIYNSLNYRNLTKRLMLDSFYGEPSQQFGHRFQSSITASSPSASYHKVNRNYRYTGIETTGDCTAKADNGFVQHQIPQTDLGYSWIRKSTIETTCSYRRLESDFTDLSGTSTIESASPSFLSSSEIGIRSDANFMHYPVYSGSLTVAQGRDNNFIPVDFTGLNTVIYEHISSSNNTLGGFSHIDKRGGLVTSSVKDSSHLGGAALDLNNILLNRGGIHGYPSWQQLRAGNHPVARKMRKENMYSFAGVEDRTKKNLPENKDPNRFLRFTPALSPAISLNSAIMSPWVGNIQIAKAKSARTVDSNLLRFTESVATTKYKPLNFVKYYKQVGVTVDETKMVPVDLSDPEDVPSVKVETNIAFSSMLQKFSNPDMEQFLRIKQPDLKPYLMTFMDVDAVSEADEIFYTETIFPRNQNTYLQKIRGRNNFEVTWWSPTRSQRVTSSVRNSQDKHIATTSKWLLDAQDKFGITSATTLGGSGSTVAGVTTVGIGESGEGELLSAAGLFRTGPMGTGTDSMVSASATYARRFPETPKTFRFSFKDNGFEADDLGSNTMTISVSRIARTHMQTYIGIAGPTETTPPTNNDRAIAWIKLSSSSDSTSKVVDQIVDGLNSYDGSDGIAAKEFIFKDVARAYADKDKRSFYIEFFESFENEYYPGYGKTTDFRNNAGTPKTNGRLSLTIGGFSSGGSYADNHLSASIVQNTYLAGATSWDAGKLAGRTPFNYSSYEEYAEQLRALGKDHSIIPEYRISEEMSNYIGRNTDDPYFECTQEDFLSVNGAEDDILNSSKDDFYKVLSHSDFLQHFDVVQETVKSYNENNKLDTLTLTCKGLKKLLPYKGFYPSQRMLQLSTLFSQSYGPDTLSTPERYKTLTGKNASSMGTWRTAMAPFYAPGLAFNSVKAGVAVDYPLFVPKNDRQWLNFCTRFNASASNVIKIGSSHDWGIMFSGSGRTAGTAAESAISISMWVHPGTTAARWGSLVNLGGDKASVSDPGFRFYLDSGEPKLLVGTTSNTILFEPSGSNLKDDAAGAPRPRLAANQWNHIAVTYPLNGNSPTFYLNGSGSNSVTGSSAGSVTPTSILNSSEASAHNPDCFIGNLPGNSDDKYAATTMAVSEVCFFNQRLEPTDISGLYGGGIKQRGAWRPDLCVSPEKSNSLIGWFRMGNDTGIDNTETTDNKRMVNWAGDVNNKIGIGDTGDSALTNLYTPVDSIMTASFSGFSDSVDSTTFDQTGYGIISLENLETAGFTAAKTMTGSYKYPSYITGSAFNQTMDGGVPRIGTATWAQSADVETFWEKNAAEYGIQRVDRVPFEAIVDPSNVLVPNKLSNLGGGIFDERFDMYETEPHPSASLQPCSYMRSRITDTYSTHTGSGGAYLARRDGEAIVWGMPNTSSLMTSSFSLTNMRALGETLYSRAANNFYAECMSFFLQDGHSTVVASADAPVHPVDYGKTYKMKLRISRVPGEDFQNYNLPQAFGPPVDAGIVRPDASHVYSNSYSSYAHAFGHGYSAYTPPHFDSFAEVEYTFTPDETELYDVNNPAAIETILNRISIDNKDANSPTIKYNRYIKGTGSLRARNAELGTNQLREHPEYSGITDASFSTAELVAATSSLNKAHAMQISASLAGTTIDDASLIPIFEDNDINKQILRKSWALHTRWEVPNLDFRGVSVTKAKERGLSVPRGMWHQTGNIDNPTNSIEIIPPDKRKFGDLSELLGMHFKVNGAKLENVKKKNIGTVAESRKIREAVVAIPFTQNQLGNKKFFKIPKPMDVYQAVINAGFKNYMIEEEAIERPNRKVPNFIQTMVSSMMKYVIPPKLNFLKYNGTGEGDKYIEPFMMYFFEFNHILNKQDIANIWQNLPPDIGLDTYHRNETDTIKQEVVISHVIDEYHPLDNVIKKGDLDEVQWMIFKVKQRAETDYFQKIKRDRLPENHPERIVREKDMFKYGFNWPYDYFSLVELIKVDVQAGFNKVDPPEEPEEPERFR